MSTLAISYARFSSDAQAKGSSLQRQLENAEKYAAEHNLRLDPQFKLEDKARSAYTGENIREGVLGELLEKIRAGRIPKGTTLIVESFDRLSRAKPRLALPVFLDIINNGIRLAILTDPPKVFDDRDDDTDVSMLLFGAIMEMMRAHGESRRKSQLLLGSWKIKRDAVVATKTVMTSRVPLWINAEIDLTLPRGHQDKRKLELNPERAAIVKQMVMWAESGIGSMTICKRLNKLYEPWSRLHKRRQLDGGPPRPKREGPPCWEHSYVHSVLTSRALYGAIEIDGEVVKDYFPEIIDEARYYRLISIRSGNLKGEKDNPKGVKGNRKGNLLTNLFSGITMCGYCGYPMHVAGYKNDKSVDPPIKHKYVACHGARIGATDCKMHTWFIKELEDSVIFWLDQVDFSVILGDDNRNAVDRARDDVLVTEFEVERLNKRIANSLEAVAEGIEGARDIAKADEIKLRDAKARLEAQRGLLAAADRGEAESSGRMKNLIKLYRKIKHATDDLELRAIREQLVTAVGMKVEKITLYPVGHNLGGDRADRFIDILFKNGATRRIEPGEC
jgi:DNA invertase Pin-like site-specific DNA recombinase